MNIPFLLYLVSVIASLIGSGGAFSVRHDLFPDIVDTSHASPPAAKFFHGYFTAKSLHNATWWLNFFHPMQIVYYDATLGIGFPSRSLLVTTFIELTQEWPKNATSYPLQILGDTSSAVVHYVDTPGLFGAAEIRSISAVDFRDGKVTRQVDYWDGRRNPDDTASPNSQYPYGLGVETVDEHAAPEMNRTAHQLNAALTANDSDAAAALFSYDAIWMDLTLRTRQEGQPAIGRYLQRALAGLPYGSGATLRHVLGSIQGGGYEWEAEGNSTLNGITALELDGSGLVTQLTTVWDGSRMSDSSLQALVALSIEP
ncbi:hypothetical protein L207DRAFT_622283 [Hyaloscypha variabilis F]|uniref:SnoaL-like domain-containing protein n=1 Tax=Hyaloscypha variabilis (strain UAMH 11265 / GT02V1 / F) TaxID=1149755 RepID=A0A2J6RUV6_HYAVF|nr:hypothetical protein L207DRAFT_622283 [Hyaloscypha variabilis F]